MDCNKVMIQIKYTINLNFSTAETISVGYAHSPPILGTGEFLVLISSFN